MKANDIILCFFTGAALLLTGCAAHEKIKASGTVEITEVDVAPKISARVTKKVLDDGALVASGQIVVLLDNTIVAQQRDAAAIALKNAQASFDRSKDMLATNSIPRQQYEGVETQLAMAKAAYVQAQDFFNEAEVKAPWAGTVLKVHVEEGELVSPNTPVFTLGDMTKVKVTIYVPLIGMSRIKLGDAAQIKIDAYKDRSFEGRVTFISEEAEFTPKNVQTEDERIKQVFAVEVTADNKEMMMKPGVPCDVTIGD
jgi:HlyD family secretion protein